MFTRDVTNTNDWDASVNLSVTGGDPAENPGDSFDQPADNIIRCTLSTPQLSAPSGWALTGLDNFSFNGGGTITPTEQTGTFP